MPISPKNELIVDKLVVSSMIHSAFAVPFLSGQFPFNLPMNDVIAISSSLKQSTEIAETFLDKANIPDDIDKLVEWICAAASHGESAENTIRWLFRHHVPHHKFFALSGP